MVRETLQAKSLRARGAHPLAQIRQGALDTSRQPLFESLALVVGNVTEPDAASAGSRPDHPSRGVKDLLGLGQSQTKIDFVAGAQRYTSHVIVGIDLEPNSAFTQIHHHRFGKWLSTSAERRYDVNRLAVVLPTPHPSGTVGRGQAAFDLSGGGRLVNQELTPRRECLAQVQ